MSGGGGCHIYSGTVKVLHTAHREWRGRVIW